MKATTKRRVYTASAALALAALFAFLFFPRAVPVDVARVVRGPIDDAVADQGQAQPRDAYTVVAPVAGRLERVTLKVGDQVVARQTVVARIRPSDAPLLDPSVRAQREAALAAARAQRDQLVVQNRRAAEALERTRSLVQGGFASPQTIDDAAAASQAAAEAVMAAEAQVRAAQAALIGPDARAAIAGGSAAILAPVSGFVTRVVEPSERTLAAGAPILEVSDPAALEAAIEFLSQDAVRVREGMAAEVFDWGGPGVLAATVRRVEPSAFTKISALGVEEQRAIVRLQITAPREQWSRLAVGYRVWGRVFLRREARALKVPLGALVRSGGRWAVYQVKSRRAHLVPVAIGAIADREAEVLQGLDEAAEVVDFPSDEVHDGARVAAQGAAAE
ncbi:MAG TPA: HlyD family efflux transporter periplasmic adaptor subunit [Burkholderiaceae bacterium]|nr:HlyD family efflux transporter periplasmic adaptor subunit [Burkholderiaceae bacterium]